MKFWSRFYHFLGGVYFALFLISATALFVIAGTFIESLTESHRYAALFTYSNPLFAALLWGFFINILFSALRRWPFRWQHLPFLTTHLGLLMILAGVLAKHYFGLQGTMSLSEGSASDEVVEINTYAIQVEDRNESPKRYPLQKTIGGAFKGNVAEEGNAAPLTIRLSEFYPHCKECLATWVKKSHVFINGLSPIPLHRFRPEEETIPLSTKVRFQPSLPFPYDVYALQTSDIKKTLTQLYRQNAKITITERASGKVLVDLSLDKLEDLSLDLDLDFSLIDGFQNPFVKVVFNKVMQDSILIPLNGKEALFNLNPDSRKLLQLPFAVDIVTPPILAIIQNEFDDVFLIAISPHGKVSHEAFPNGYIKKLISYEDGFYGYAVESHLPLKTDQLGREEKEKALTNQLVQQLKQAEKDEIELSPPLQLMKEACKSAQIDFPETAAIFLSPWNGRQAQRASQTPQVRTMLAAIDWKQPPPEEKQAFLLSSYLKIYGISPTEIFHIPEEEEMNHLVAQFLTELPSKITLETPAVSMQFPEIPGKKLEDNTPKVTLFVSKQGRAEKISLAYDKTGRGLKWPILNGEYKIRFQPLFKKIPYRVRLRQARQINYANSSQPYSFESDLIFKDLRDHASVEKTISMNNVHETWDGYRFYLSSIAPPNETEVKSVQIAVNYDPAKYLLTYPGAIVLSCGIFMLFGMRPYRRSKP